MVKSMTGYGRGEFKLDDKEFLVEIRSINHRYMDFFIRIPRKISFLEDKVRKYINSNFSRGKFEIFITYENYNDSSKDVLLDKPLTKAYINAIKELQGITDLKDDLSVSLIANFPDVLKVQNEKEDTDELWKLLELALKKAVDSLVDMRINEGNKLQESIKEKLKIIELKLEAINNNSDKVVLDYKKKLEDRLKELVKQETIDETRMTTEVAIFADRCSIDEEIVRLSSHINQLEENLSIKKPVGRKLDFILQEINREINTIGSKANNLEITKNVVEVKCEVEKIREQVQNIE
ncbi:MAG: YicC/YloC family endoribonuclease [Clostridiales bacterium]